jgi:hypothetical protein
MSAVAKFRPDYRGAKQADLLVLKTLAEQAEDSGMVFFSIEGLSEDTGHNSDVVQEIIFRQLMRGTLRMPTEGERLREYYRLLRNGPFASTVQWRGATPGDVLEDIGRNVCPVECEYSVICLRFARGDSEASEE